jgi:hypothetical protein
VDLSAAGDVVQHEVAQRVYGLTADQGWISLGISRDTATFAVDAILSWWSHLGHARYPNRLRHCSSAGAGRQVPTFRTGARTELAPPSCRAPPGQSGTAPPSVLDDRDYPKGVTVTDEQLAAVNITRGNSTRLELPHNPIKNYVVTASVDGASSGG